MTLKGHETSDVNLYLLIVSIAFAWSTFKNDINC